MPRACLVFLLAAAASGAGQPPRIGSDIPVPFFDADQLQVANGVVAGVFSSLIEERSLYAVRLEDGQSILRVDGVGEASCAFDGGSIVYADRGGSAVVRVGLDGRRSEIWRSDPDGRVIGPIHASGSLVRFVVAADGGLRSVRVDTTTGAQALSLEEPMPTDPIEIFNSETSTFVFVPATGQGFWWHDTDSWQVVPTPGNVKVLALAADSLIGLRAEAPNGVMRRALSDRTMADWETVYEPRGTIEPRSIGTFDAGSRVAFLERSDVGMSLVRLTLEAPGRAERVALPTAVGGNARAPVAWSASQIVWAARRDGRLFLSVAEMPAAAAPATSDVAPAAVPDRRDDRARRALDWLRAQLTAPFTTRDGSTARLIDSYEDDERAGWVYDAALAAIAFTAAEEPSVASDLLAGLGHLQDAAGSWTFSYEPDTATPRGSDRYVGSMAWVVMAANFYEWETGDARFAPMARRGLAYLETFRNTDSGSALVGAFSMGPTKPDVVSTENNVDCYAAFLWRARLDHDDHDDAIAEGIRRVVQEQLWSVAGAGGNRGFFLVGPRTSSLYLDVQTWTTLALGDASSPMFTAALDAAAERLAVDEAHLGAVDHVAGLDESSETTDGRTVWTEGTEGMVAALLSLGRADRARRYQDQTARLQTTSGGIPYATVNARGWPTAAAVSATAWFVLNRLSPARNPFRPDIGSLK